MRVRKRPQKKRKDEDHSIEMRERESEGGRERKNNLKIKIEREIRTLESPDESLNQNNSVKKRDPNGIKILGLTFHRHSGRDPWFPLTCARYIQDISVQHTEVVLKWLLWIKEYWDIL